MYSVYILQSKKDEGYYIGCTSDLNRRIKSHNSGKTRSVKHRRPLELVHREDYNSSEEAYKREKQIKSYKSGEAFKKLIANHGSVA